MADKKINTLFNYIGGKGWMKNDLRQAITNVLTQDTEHKITAYVEPFAGGLGAFLNIYELLLNHNIHNVILNDINSHLIGCYKLVAQDPDLLIAQYEIIEADFKTTIKPEAYGLHKTKDKAAIKELLVDAENYYKKIRSLFNEGNASVLNTSAYLLFLQNHCFNGVYRENSKGHYNTPFNWEAKTFETAKIKEKVYALHNIFKKFKLDFTLGSFDGLSYKDNTLYYLDPPYLNETQVENKYNKDSFSLDTQRKLIDSIKDTNFIYSNHYSEMLINEFKNATPNMQLKTIARKNIISASVESRKTDKLEMLVTHILV